MIVKFTHHLLLHVWRMLAMHSVLRDSRYFWGEGVLCAGDTRHHFSWCRHTAFLYLGTSAISSCAAPYVRIKAEFSDAVTPTCLCPFLTSSASHS